MDKETIKAALLSLRVIDPVTNCWRFTGYVANTGYGYLYIFQHNHRVHRLAAYAYLNLDITDPQEQANHKDDLCKNKDCFNPDHLYLGNQSQNVQDSVNSRTHRNSRKTHCKRGHSFTIDNIYIVAGKKQCRTCYQARNKASRERIALAREGSIRS